MNSSANQEGNNPNSANSGNTRRAMASNKGGSAGSDTASGGSRPRQDGPVAQSYKIASDAQTFLNGSLNDMNSTHGGAAN